MFKNMYEEYLYVIGKLKDVHDLHADADSKNIHTFTTKDKREVFKLFFGKYTKSEEENIVVSFQITLRHPEVITWFVAIHNIHPQIKIHDSYIEDSAGEVFLGEDAETLQGYLIQQEVLGDWLEESSKEEIKEFVNSKVVGTLTSETTKFFSPSEKDKAIIEFERTTKPIKKEEIH